MICVDFMMLDCILLQTCSAYTPVIKFYYGGIPIDLVFARRFHGRKLLHHLNNLNSPSKIHRKRPRSDSSENEAGGGESDCGDGIEEKEEMKGQEAASYNDIGRMWVKSVCVF